MVGFTWIDFLVLATYLVLVLVAGLLFSVLGVDGAIGSTFNVNGRRSKEIFEAAKNGDIERARELQHITNDFITDVLDNGLYQTLKGLLSENGVDAGYCRQPMKTTTDKMRERIKEINSKYEF